MVAAFFDVGPAAVLGNAVGGRRGAIAAAEGSKKAYRVQKKTFDLGGYETTGTVKTKIRKKK